MRTLAVRAAHHLACATGTRAVAYAGRLASELGQELVAQELAQAARLLLMADWVIPTWTAARVTPLSVRRAFCATRSAGRCLRDRGA